MATIQQLIDARATEAKAEGKAEGKAELIARLLVRRFGALTPAVATRLAVADGATLDRWAERVLEISSPDELLSS